MPTKLGARITRGLNPNRAECIYQFDYDVSFAALELAEVPGFQDDVDANLLLCIKNSDQVVNGTTVTDEDTGEDGDDVETEFSADFNNAPCIPYSCQVSATIAGETVTAEDGGDGKLYLRTPGTVAPNFPVLDDPPIGEVDYFAGTFTVTFPTPPDNGTPILVSYRSTTAVPLRGAVLQAPTSGSDIIPLLPYWGDLSLYLIADVNKLARIDIDLLKMANGLARQ